MGDPVIVKNYLTAAAGDDLLRVTPNMAFVQCRCMRVQAVQNRQYQHIPVLWILRALDAEIAQLYPEGLSAEVVVARQRVVTIGRGLQLQPDSHALPACVGA